MTWPWVLGIAAAVVGVTFLAALALCRAAARGDRARVRVVEFNRRREALDYIARIGGEK